jgi:hypothetical protein
VWLGLILAACAWRTSAAQDAPDAANRGPAEPLALSARYVTVWGGPDAQYVYLSGAAAVLQGTDGLRAAQGVCRIVNVSNGGDPLYEVEVYAEGGVSDTSRPQTPLDRHRALFRAPEVKMQAYARDGVNSLRSPPRGLDILRRSGFVRPAAAAADTRPPAPQQMVATDVAIPASGLPPLEAVSESASAVANGIGATSAGAAAPMGPAGVGSRRSRPKVDPLVETAQMTRGGPPAPGDEDNGPPGPAQPGGNPMVPGGVRGGVPPADVGRPTPGGAGRPSDVDLPPIEGPPGVEVPALPANPQDQPPTIEPLPRAEPGEPEAGDAEPGEPKRAGPPVALPRTPYLPGSQRVTFINPRSGRDLDIQQIGTTPDGFEIYIVRNGVNIITQAPGQFGLIDIEADQAVIWRGPAPEGQQGQRGPNGEYIESSQQPLEVYLEGNVVVRQDQRKWAGKSDQRTLRAPQVYYNFLTDRFVAHQAEIDLFSPGLIAPFRVKSPKIEQYHDLIKQPDGTFKPDPEPKIRADQASSTGSRFPNPGFQIYQKSIDLTRHPRPSTDPISGQHLTNPGDPNPPQDLVWQIDARQNIYYMGPFPAFYWPRIVADLDDEQRAFRQFFFRTNNYFGQQLLTDWNTFAFLPGVKKPDWIDLWNFDVDYLSARTKRFPALGTEAGWFGRDLIKDLRDPYHRDPSAVSNITYNYFGYFNIWGLQDYGTDVLGQGPAIVTNGPAGSGKAGIQMSSTPPFQLDRLRLDTRHMQMFLPDDDEHEFEDLRLQLEASYYTDRYFLFEYFQQLWDRGMDQETVAFGYYKKDNQFLDMMVEGNPMNWQTETEWLPRVDSYRIGDSFLDNHLVYYTHSGLDYATITTDVMVNNPNLFAFMPYDPISNTTGTFSSGRFWTSHELDVPLNFFNAVRFVPYVQGQLVGWTDQLGAGPLGHQPSGPTGRAWGGVGSRAETTIWKRYPNVNSDILNVHGLNNKISFFVDARAAFSNVRLNSLAIQDDLDDNTYEFVRRYLAMTSFQGGILPFQYDPRHYILRNMLSPITGTTDVQASIDTVQLGVHQRLQTKRGPLGRRRIVDFMTLDATTTFFPDANRDNFGTPWGLTQYNYQWYLGDRTSLVSMGWFEFWKLSGSQPLSNNMVNGYNPNGLNVISSGISLMRPPRSTINVLYTIIDTGPIKTSALNTSIQYWLSPKWYGTFANSYDFGDGVDLGTMFTFTRIGADYLTTLGLSVDPQRMSYQFAFQITPRMTPAFRMGSNSALNSFDTRFAPSQ